MHLAFLISLNGMKKKNAARCADSAAIRSGESLEVNLRMDRTVFRLENQLSDGL